MPMRFPLSAAPLIFFGYIFTEIAAFIFIGSKIGILPVLGLVLLSAICGAALLRGNISRLIKGLSEAAHAGRLDPIQPGRRLIRLFAGVLLIIPGLVSSLFGLILALPPLADWLAKKLGQSGKLQTEFRFEEKSPGEQNGRRGKPRITDLRPDEYHAADPENSPWRKP